MGSPHDALRDISHKTLETTIAEKLGTPYLSKAKETDARAVVEGYFHPKNRSMMAIVRFVVPFWDETRWVFFVVGCGEGVVPTPAKINWYRHSISMLPHN